MGDKQGGGREGKKNPPAALSLPLQPCAGSCGCYTRPPARSSSRSTRADASTLTLKPSFHTQGLISDKESPGAGTCRLSTQLST